MGFERWRSRQVNCSSDPFSPPYDGGLGDEGTDMEALSYWCLVGS